MTKEEYISYKKTLFQEEYEAKIRRLEKAVNHPQNYVFVYCDTDAAIFYGHEVLNQVKERLFKNELMFNKKPVKWAVSECYCGNHSFFFDDEKNRVCSKCFKTYLNSWGCLMTEHTAHWESLNFNSKTHPMGMTDAFSMPAEEFDEMMNDIQNN